ncbi:MAG: amidohydrolase [Eubacteriales bacterium]|nr:amidohydrolase [Eubacteriales bacterium]
MKSNARIAEVIDQLASERLDLLKEVGIKIWKYAELSRQEYRSAKYLSDKLESMDFQVKRGVGGYPTSFVAQWKNGVESGPVIGLLCEYDALPSLSTEKKGDPGHGCGHNLFAAGAITTAGIIKAYLEETGINATIKVFGTPSEESYGSKPFMVKQGIFDGVDFFMGFHPLEFNGVLYATHNAIIGKKYRFFGKTSHAGAEPELGISALDAVEIMNVAANYLREHITQDARIHYIITHGGEAANIVPDFAESHYIARAQDLNNLKQISNKIDNAAKGAALATGCTYEIEYIESFANTVLNRPYAEIAQSYIQHFGPPNYSQEDQDSVSEFGKREGILMNIEELPDKQGFYGASTDEGDVSWVAPWIRICMAIYADGTPGHSVEVTRQSNMPTAHKGMLHNIKVCSSVIAHLLENQKDLEQVKEYHKNAMAKRTYDRTFNPYPKPSFFPNAPGFAVDDSGNLTLKPEIHPFLEGLESFSIFLYREDKLIGQGHKKDVTQSKLNFEIAEDLLPEEVLTIKYNLSDRDSQTLLGYFKI